MKTQMIYNKIAHLLLTDAQLVPKQQPLTQPDPSRFYTEHDIA